MGRGKLAMELINNAKARNMAFKNRKISLKKKAYELSTLCDVPVCVLAYSRDHPPDSEPPLIYPENRDEALSIINRYLAAENCSKKRSLDLQDVVQQQQQQGNIKRSRVDDSMAPNCPNLVASNLDGLNRDQLYNTLSVLDQKLQIVHNRIAEFENYVDPDFGVFWSQFGNCDQQQQQLGLDTVQGFMDPKHCNMVSVFDQKPQFDQNKIAGFENCVDQDYGVFCSQFGNCNQRQELGLDPVQGFMDPQFCISS